MTGNELLQITTYLGGAARAGQAVRRVHGECLQRHGQLGPRRLALPACRRQCRRFDDVARVRARISRIQWNRTSCRLCAAASATSPALESSGVCRHRTAYRFQYRGQLRHQYELAKLCRRDDAQLFHANGGADRAELRVRRLRDGCAGGARAWSLSRNTDTIGNFWVDLVRGVSTSSFRFRSC